MKNSLTIETILNSPVGSINQHLKEVQPKRKKPVKARNDSKEVQWIHWQLKYWAIENGFIIIPELRFDKKRKYRFDFAIMKGITEEQARKFDYNKTNIIGAVEYQGGVFMVKSGHTNPDGATRDCDKSNLAQSLGWHLLTFTVLNYKSVLQSLEKIIKK